MTIQVSHPDYEDRAVEVKPMEKFGTVSEVRKLMAKAKQILARCEDQQVDFREHKTACRTCSGSGWAPTYRNGKRGMFRCPTWQFYPGDKAGTGEGKCSGNPDWQEWENSNKQDLCNTIWANFNQIEGTAEYKMNWWLKKLYGVEWPEDLSIEQLEYVLIKVNQKLTKQQSAVKPRQESTAPAAQPTRLEVVK